MVMMMMMTVKMIMAASAMESGAQLGPGSLHTPVVIIVIIIMIGIIEKDYHYDHHHDGNNGRTLTSESGWMDEQSILLAPQSGDHSRGAFRPLVDHY